MSMEWVNAFRTLREQFLKESGNDGNLRLALTSFPSWEAFDHWRRERVDPETTSRATSGVPQLETECLWGDQVRVKRFEALATAAGSLLPSQFRVPIRPFPFWNELANRAPSAILVWAEFIFVAEVTAFSIEQDWPDKGSRVALLKGNPFLHSALAIDKYLSQFSDERLTEFQQTLRNLVPLVSTIGGRIRTIATEAVLPDIETGNTESSMDDYSPFTVPSMEELGLRWEDDNLNTPPSEQPPMALGALITVLRP